MRTAVLAILLGTALWAGAQPARIILIRHGEKPADPENTSLNEEGRIRALKLVKWLTQGKVLGTNGTPVLYAAAASRTGRGSRCLETLEPTARKLGVRVETPCRSADYELLARSLLYDHSLRGKNVVVCWVHEYLPHLAATLGVNPPPPKWKGDDYDSAYVITFPRGKATLEVTKQRLKKN
jgi:hypothetical protein